LCDDLDTELLRTYFSKSDAFIDLLIKFDIENILPDMFLLRGNKLARYSSIDYCTPLLDEDLVEYVCKMSGSNLFKVGNRKIILKRILNKLGVPLGVVYRKRKPLLAPTGKWLKKGLNIWMKELLSYENVSSQGFFVHSQVDKIFRLAENDLRAQIQLWAVSFFTLWFEIFISNNAKYKSFKTSA
jgi:asparagine synthetase B (glutamine-hydrolysing)